MFVINTKVAALHNYDIGETLRCKVMGEGVRAGVFGESCELDSLGRRGPINYVITYFISK